MPLLEVKDLQVRVEEREILHGLSLTVNKGEVHAIMGPNGSGKSTLSHVIAGKPGYEVTGGEILFKGEDLLEMEPDERAAKGVFLAFQYPVEIPGVATMTFLRTALNAQRKARGESEYSTPDFLKKVREVAASLNIPQDMLRRGVNVGFSGGEKKRNEVLQMALFEPSLCILDEMDSGLDIDALRVAADGVNALRSPDRAMVVITHYQRLLNYIVPDFVHVMSKGRVVKSGGKELALELEASGYAQFEEAIGRGLRFRRDHARKYDLNGFDHGCCIGKADTDARPSELFAAARDRLPGSGPVSEVRRGAFDDFAQRGLPHRRIEEWKYTDLRALLREIAAACCRTRSGGIGARGRGCDGACASSGVHKLVLVDGVFVPQLSDSARRKLALQVRALRDILESDEVAARADLLITTAATDTMVSLNTAMATDGVVIDVAENVEADQAAAYRPYHHPIQHRGIHAFVAAAGKWCTRHAG